MSKDPAFLFYYQNYTHGTRRFSFEEKGAYVELLCEQADKINPYKADPKKPLPHYCGSCRHGSGGFDINFCSGCYYVRPHPHWLKRGQSKKLLDRCENGRRLRKVKNK